MAFWRSYCHLVWTTKDRHPLITPTIEQALYGYIIGKADNLGCIIHAIGGIEDHIHLVASIPPKISIAEFVQKIKGSSAYSLNHGPHELETPFAWQRGYGVFSLGSKQLDEAIAYVAKQKIHHQKGSIISVLERSEQADDGPTGNPIRRAWDSL